MRIVAPIFVSAGTKKRANSIFFGKMIFFYPLLRQRCRRRRCRRRLPSVFKAKKKITFPMQSLWCQKPCPYLGGLQQSFFVCVYLDC